LATRGAIAISSMGGGNEGTTGVRLKGKKKAQLEECGKSIMDIRQKPAQVSSAVES